MALVTVLAALLGLAPPLSAPDPWSWNAPSACPDGDAVKTEIEQHLGEPMAALRSGAWSVLGTVTHDEDRGYAVALVIETPDGRHDRLLTDPSSCEALSSSAALLIALALGPEPGEPLAPDPKPGRDASPSLDTKPTPKVGSEPAVLEPDLALDPIPAAPAPDPLTFAISLAPGIDWGTLRGVTPLGRLALAWQPRRLRVSIAAHFGGNPSFELPTLPIKIRLWRWSLAGEIGPVPTLGRFEFPLMAGVEAGQLLLTPSALIPRSQVAWAALLVAPGVSWVPLEWFAVTARAGTTIAFVQPTFELDGLDPILVPSRIGVRAYLGVEFRVPLIMKTD